MSQHDLRHELEQADLAMRDPTYVATLVPALGRLVRLYFRADVRGIAALPVEGGALVALRDGGLPEVDVPLLAAAFVDRFGPERPLYLPALGVPVRGLPEVALRRCGYLRVTDDPTLTSTLTNALRSGAVVVVLARAGYLRSAIDAGVPVVPVVSIGGREARWPLAVGAAGAAAARRLGLDLPGRVRRLPGFRTASAGLRAVLPLVPPLPAKIVTQVLEPLSPAEVDALAGAGEGSEPDLAAAEAEVRRRMRSSLADLSRERRFPVLG